MHYWLCRSMYGRTFDTLVVNSARCSLILPSCGYSTFRLSPLTNFLRVSFKLHEFHDYGNYKLQKSHLRLGRCSPPFFGFQTKSPHTAALIGIIIRFCAAITSPFWLMLLAAPQFPQLSDSLRISPSCFLI